MTTYSSKPIELPLNVEVVYNRLSDIAAFQQKVNQLPQEVKEKIGSVRFTDDSIIISAAPVGDMVLTVSEKILNKRVAFTAQGAPVPLIMAINMEPSGDNKTVITTAIDVEIPAMLKPMVGPKLQEAAEKFGDMIRNLAKA
ncbi:MAG: hypothetical protein NC343_04770 [Muribaculum sp.]|nr:hypothetical protein [Muribaculaceae bacterium]MCM1081045.1 hypothetical protein [Muribaculum sp.]